MGWSGWKNLESLSRDAWKGLPANPGLYWVSAVDGSKARHIVRAVHTDEDGTIYVGRSLNNIRDRVRSFWRCASDKDVEGLKDTSRDGGMPVLRSESSFHSIAWQ